MKFVSDLSLTTASSRRKTEFTPLTLAAGGALFDPSVQTSLSQSAASPQPVNADGTPVGRVSNLASQPGPDLVTNGDMSAGSTGWSPVGTTVLTPNAGRLEVSRASGATRVFQSPTLQEGREYQLDCTIDNTAASADLDVLINATTSTVDSLEVLRVPGGAAADLSGFFEARSGDTHLIFNRASQGGIPFSLDNVQLADTGGSARQETASARPLYRTNGTEHWLEFDGVDDGLIVSLPDLGSDATLAYVTASGVTINSGQTIGGSYTLPTANWYACLVVDRPLTAGETGKLTAWLKGKAGI